ncbi:MAG: DUF4129 domain-containing protein [Flavobacteriales bacterium]
MRATFGADGSCARGLGTLLLITSALVCRGQNQGAVDSMVQEMVAAGGADSMQVPEPEYVTLDTMLPEQEVRAFDEAALDALRADPRYQYEREVSQAPNAWDRFWEMVRDWISDLLKRLEDATGLKFVSWFWDYIWFAVFVVALVIALIVFRRRMLSKVFARAAAGTGSVRTLDEDITADDLPEQLAGAERAGEWRRALRLHYLLVLRHLVDEDHITWKPQYTDRDYQTQLTDALERERFARLSFIFKWVWYGEAQVERAQYERLVQGFIDFRSKRAA